MLRPDGQYKHAVCWVVQFFHFSLLGRLRMIAHLSPIAEEMNHLMGDVSEIDRIFEEGTNRAVENSEPILGEAYDIVGFIRSRQ